MHKEKEEKEEKEQYTKEYILEKIAKATSSMENVEDIRKVEDAFQELFN